MFDMPSLCANQGSGKPPQERVKRNLALKLTALAASMGEVAVAWQQRSVTEMSVEPVQIGTYSGHIARQVQQDIGEWVCPGPG
jgi:hypothetical protein